MCSFADWQRRRRRETQHSELATMRRRLAITQRWGTTPKSTFWNSDKSTFWNSYNCRPWPSTRPTGQYQPNCSSTEPQPIQSKIHSFFHPSSQFPSNSYMEHLFSAPPSTITPSSETSAEGQYFEKSKKMCPLLTPKSKKERPQESFQLINTSNLSNIYSRSL